MDKTSCTSIITNSAALNDLFQRLLSAQSRGERFIFYEQSVSDESPWGLR